MKSRLFVSLVWVIALIFPPHLVTAQSVVVEGVILTPAERSAAIDALGVGPIDPGTAVIGFDLEAAIAALCDAPNTFAIEDDGIPVVGPDNSGGPFTGVDVDSAGGLNSSGIPVFAADVLSTSFGPDIAPGANTLGECLDPAVDGLFGDTESEGFPGNVLGLPDAQIVYVCDPSLTSGFTSIGSGGILEVSFFDRINDSNVVGNYDLFLFDAGGAGDNAVFSVDAVPGVIKLTPEVDFNLLDTAHTVTAQVVDTASAPLPGIDVMFHIQSGPNSGDGGVVSTDTNGQAEFVYTGDGGPGVDEIVTSFVDPFCGTVESGVALKFWDNDCNENDIPDTCDLDCGGFASQCAQFPGCGLSEDLDDNGTPDECNRTPDCSLALPSVENLWPPNHKFHYVSIANVTDPDGDDVSVTISAVFQDEPLNYNKGVKSCPNAAGVGDTSVGLRAQRSGSGDGRVYHLNYLADDRQGGTCTGSVTVCVPHDQSANHVCIDQGPRFDATVCD